MSETWPEQRARLESLVVFGAGPAFYTQDRAAIREALRRLDLLQGHFDDMLRILEPPKAEGRPAGPSRQG